MKMETGVEHSISHERVKFHYEDLCNSNVLCIVSFNNVGCFIRLHCS